MTNPAATPDIRKFDYVDALRGIAALSVVAVHASLLLHAQTLPVPLLRIAEVGTFGPHLFYMVSAFTLMHSMHSRGVHEQGGTFAFLLRRFFRIAPLYYLAILTYALLGIDGIHWNDPAVVHGPSASAVVANVLFVHSFSPAWINGVVPGGWSVGIEFVFYLMLPVLVRIVTSLNRALLCLGAFLVVQALFDHAIAGRLDPANAEQLGTFLICALPHNLPVFGFGFILFFLVRGGRQSSAHGLAFLGGMLVVAVLVGHDFPVNVKITAGFMAVAFALANPVALGWPRRFVVNRLTRWLGRISFSMYLSNFLCIRALMNTAFETWTPFPTANYLLAFGLASMFIVSLSYALHVAIEQPMIRLGKRVIAKTGTIPQPALLGSDT